MEGPVSEHPTRDLWESVGGKVVSVLHALRRRLHVLEWILIAGWALVVGRSFLNFDPQVVPIGNEFGSQIQANHLWTQFEKCGWCAVWNGSEQGGSPAFADPHGSMLHPIVAVATLIWGVVNGVKVTILISLWLAGMAQWWIAKELKLGALPRLWSAGIAVAGGDLAAKMETGNYHMILSLSMASLFLAATLHLWHGNNRRAAVVLGALIASVLLAGQGYVQVALLGIAPAGLILLLDGKGHWSPVWKHYVVAVILGLLLAAPFLIPFAHFSPNFTKDADVQFAAVQPLQYLPLNLVINDFGYYHTEVLQKQAYPQLHALYIGWIPVLLAVFGLSRIRKPSRRVAWFMVTIIIVIFLLGSATFFKDLVGLLPFLGWYRFAPMIAGMAIPPILGFAAYGLDELFQLSKQWPSLSLGLSGSANPSMWRIPLQWILLIPLIYSLQSVRDFAQLWFKMDPRPQEIGDVLAALKTDSLQWVEPPFGAHRYIEPAVALGYKLSPGFMDLHWGGRKLPDPVLYASFEGEPPGALSQVGTVDGAKIYALDNAYAAVHTSGGSVPCQAFGSGGQITVRCNTSAPGRLVVQENMWTGWYGWMDGSRVPLLGGGWLEVNAPVGNHQFVFRYLPWDVPLGLVLFALGLVACVLTWRSPLSQKSVTPETDQL